MPFLFVVLAAIALIIFIGKIKKNSCPFDLSEVEIIGMKEIISVFKRPEVIEKLKSNTNYKAVVVKEQMEDGYLKIVATIFDSGKNEIIENSLQAWKTKVLEPELEEAFGDKSMLILQ